MKTDHIIKRRLCSSRAMKCAYCSIPIIDHKARVLKNFYNTAYGLLCFSCRGSAKAIKSYKKGDIIENEAPIGDLKRLQSPC